MPSSPGADIPLDPVVLVVNNDAAGLYRIEDSVFLGVVAFLPSSSKLGAVVWDSVTEW